MKPGKCLIAKQSRKVLRDAEILANSISYLNRSLSLCRECECAANCRFIQDFNAQFEAALQFVMDEWNLAGTI